NDLNELVAVTGEAAFVCFPSCDGERMAFRGVGRINLFVDGPFKRPIRSTSEGIHPLFRKVFYENPIFKGFEHGCVIV
ncbi:MAG: hypothetical protein B5M55_06335, partial [Desulfococcus sp. 4484_242]